MKSNKWLNDKYSTIYFADRQARACIDNKQQIISNEMRKTNK